MAFKSDLKISSCLQFIIYLWDKDHLQWLVANIRSKNPNKSHTRIKITESMPDTWEINE